MGSKRESIRTILVAVALLALWEPAVATGQVPDGCVVPPGHLIPGDPPEGFPNVGVIVAINGRYNAALSTMPASAAVGAPLPISVAREYNWGPDCRGHVRFVFFADPPSGEPVEPSTDPSGDAIKSVPKGTGTVVLGDPVGGATHVAELGVQGVLSGFELDWPPDGIAIDPPPGTEWIGLEGVVGGGLAEGPLRIDPGDIGGHATGARRGEGNSDGAESSRDDAADVGRDGADAPGGNPFPHGEPPPCDWKEVRGTWHVTFLDGQGKPLAVSSGPISNDDEDDRDFVFINGARIFDPGSSEFNDFVDRSAFRLGIEKNFEGFGGTEWQTAVVTTQYHCDGETWMLQYVGGKDEYGALGSVRSAFRM